VAAAVAGLFAALATWLVLGSLEWRLVHDAPLMHYIAWRIGEGAVPYRDIFDMNFPGIYIVHLAILRLLGDGDLAWRAFDLAWTALGAGVIALFARPWGVAASLGAASVFVASHVAGGNWQTGQRDFVMCPFLVAGAAGVVRWAEGAGSASLWAAGAALGAAVTIKPHALVFVLAFGAVVAVVAARWRRDAGRSLTLFTTGVALPPALLTAWLAAAGALPAWIETITAYLVPLYSRIMTPRWRVHRWQMWIGILGVMLVGVAHTALAGRLSVRHVVAVLGVVAGAVHYFGQGKGWEYQLHPLVAFSAILMVAALESVLRHGRALTQLALLGGLVFVAGLLFVKGAENAAPQWIAEKEQRVDAVVRDLEPRLRPGDVVQVMDTTAGGIHALLRLHAAEPTRFIYDFHFFHDVERPIIQRLRAEFVRDLQAHPPRAIVIFEQGWPRGGYERLATFPALSALLDRDYQLDGSGPGYRIYAKRHDS
jgi:hypothetical protein